MAPAENPLFTVDVIKPAPFAWKCATTVAHRLTLMQANFARVMSPPKEHSRPMMTESDVPERKDVTERRVYNLPANLLERLRAYQIRQGITSEVEAARRLLDTALQMRDTVSDILNTLEVKFTDEKDLRVLASEVLAKHFLVVGVYFNDGDVTFKLRNGDRGQITSVGRLYINLAEAMEDDWSVYKRELDLDDEIPF